MAIQWNDSFALGLQKIDEHHKHLVELLSETHQGLVTGATNLEQTLEKLSDYTKYHFKSEELWMVNTLYPHTAAHAGEHIYFINKVSALLDHYNNGRKTLSFELIGFLEEWIVKHILKMDATLGKYLLDRRAA